MTHSGRIRGHNEDAVGHADRRRARRLSRAQAHEQVFLAGNGCVVVSDGLGGANAGEIASARVVDSLITKWRDFTHQAGSINEYRRASWMREIVLQAHRDVLNEAKADHRLTGMGATVSALSVTGHFANFVHVGDSRIYRWRNRVLTQWTADQVQAWRDWKAGQFGEEALRRHPERHVLDQVVGSAEPEGLVVQSGTRVLRPGDCFLLCSDGLTDGLTDAEIAGVLGEAGDLSEAGMNLLDAALEASGKDNITLALIRTGPWWKRWIRKWR